MIAILDFIIYVAKWNIINSLILLVIYLNQVAHFMVNSYGNIIQNRIVIRPDNFYISIICKDIKFSPSMNTYIIILYCINDLVLLSENVCIRI